MSGGEQTLMQVAIAVRDLDAAVDAWSSFLGVEPTRRLVTAPLEESKAEYHGAPTPARVKLALFELDQLTIELMEPVDKPSVWDDHLAKHGQSVHHLGFRIPDMDKGAASLERLGYPLLQSGDFGTGRYAYFDSESALGTTVELLEFYEGSEERE
jgi:methylmalonyl-CoA/ethylmalonyl-CoA epimerase